MYREKKTFKRTDRLLTPSDYKFVFNSAYKSSNKHFIILGRKNKLDHSRLGLAISKKSLKLAVSRNIVKRLVREVFRKNTGLYTNKIDFVVMARNGITRDKNSDLVTSLEVNFKKISQHFN